MVAIAVINHTVLDNFRRTLELIAGPAQLEVTLGTGEVGFPEATIDTVRADPGVEVALGLVRGTLALADDPGETLELFGVDLTQEHALERYHIGLTGGGDTLEWLADPAVDRPHQRVRRCATTSPRERPLDLSTRQGLVRFTVRGLLEPEGLARAFGGVLAVMDLPAAQLVLGRERVVDQIDVVLRPGARVSDVQARLAATLPSTLLVAPPLQRGALYESILSSFQAMLTGLSLLCLVAGIYIIYNTTSTGAVQRALVLASLRLAGADPAQLLRLLMLEACILGALGTALGIPLGLALGKLLLGMVSTSMGVIYQLRFPVEHLAIDPRSLVLVGAAGIAAALFASWFAARRVTSLEPLEVLRADARTLGGGTRSHRFVALWATLVAMSAIALALEVRLQSTAWGNAGSTLWWASSIVIAVPLVHATSSGSGTRARAAVRTRGAGRRREHAARAHADRRDGGGHRAGADPRHHRRIPVAEPPQLRAQLLRQRFPRERPGGDGRRHRGRVAGEPHSGGDRHRPAHDPGHPAARRCGACCPG